MHTQTEKTSSSRLPGTAPLLHAATGLGLYLLTLSVEVVLGASVRWLLIFLGASAVELIAPVGVGAKTLAWIAAAAPIAHSLLALPLPGRGWSWSRGLGARRPSAAESDAIEDALRLLHPVDDQPRLSNAVYVLDHPLPNAAVRGGALLLSRAVVESESLPAVLAHELGHLSSLDGRLSEAVDRLSLWDDPLSPPPATDREEQAQGGEPEGRLLWSCLRWTLRLGGGGVGRELLAPLWQAYWRTSEYVADAYAASLGQGEDLAQHLADHELLLDAAHPRFLFDRSEHPPVALRIERLLDPAMAVSK